MLATSEDINSRASSPAPLAWQGSNASPVPPELQSTSGSESSKAMPAINVRAKSATSKKQSAGNLNASMSIPASPLNADQAAVTKAAQKQWEKERKNLQDELNKNLRHHQKLHKDLIESRSNASALELSIEHVHEKYKKEIEEHQHEIQQLHDKIRAMQNKLEKLPLLESNLIDLYMEFRDLSQQTEGQRQEEVQKQLVHERSALVTQSPLVVLENLRVSLRKLVSDNVRSCLTLKGLVESSAMQVDSAVQSATDSQQRMSKDKSEFQKMVAAHQKEKEELQEVINDWKDRFEVHNRANKERIAELLDTITKKDHEIEQLRDCLERRDEILLRKEGRFVKVKDLEDKLRKVQTQHELKVHELEEQNAKNEQKLRDVNSKVIHIIQTENTQLREEMQRMKRELHSAKVAVSRTNVIKLQDQAAHAQRKQQAGDFELVQLRAANETLKQHNDDLKNRAENMREEYARLYGAVQREMDKKSAEDSKALYEASKDRIKDTEAEIVKQLEERERECHELQRRLKKLILQQHRDSKYYKLERDILLGELTDVQEQNEQLGGPPPRIMDIDRRDFNVPAKLRRNVEAGRTSPKRRTLPLRPHSAAPTTNAKPAAP